MARIRYGGNVRDKITKAIVEALTTLGYKAALGEYRKKTFTNRTFNLHDSYGSAVYVNGVLVPDSVKFVLRSRSTTNITRKRNMGAKNGREALWKFFDSPRLNLQTNYITVVVAAAMWYAGYVESKGKYVLDERNVQQYISSNYMKTLEPILVKYKLEQFIPTVRIWLGTPNVSYIS